jgi:multiple sugar transport system substrate-binding protein
MLKRRDLLATAAALAAAPGVRAAAPTKIIYWHHSTSQEEMRGMQRVTQLFSAAHPDITVQQEDIPNPDYMAKFTAAVVAKTPPDVTMVAAERFADMMSMNALVDITDRVNAWPLKPNFPDNRWKPVTANGRIYGVPMYTFVDWVYYRKDWFDEAGIAGPPKTFDEMLETAKKLTDASKNRYGFGLRGGAGGQEFVLDAIEAYGSPLVIDGRNAIDRPKAVAALKFWSELFTVHKVVPPSAPNDGFRQIIEGFKTGQTAMTWHHTGSLAELVRDMKPGTFFTATRPAGPAVHIAHVAYLFNGLMKTEHADAAWDWVTFWGTPDASIANLEETGYFPASSAVARDPRITGNKLYDAAVATFDFGRAPPSFTGAAGWSQNVVLPEYQKILVGNSTPEKAVDAIMKGLDAALS